MPPDPFLEVLHIIDNVRFAYAIAVIFSNRGEERHLLGFGLTYSLRGVIAVFAAEREGLDDFIPVIPHLAVCSYNFIAETAVRHKLFCELASEAARDRRHRQQQI